MSLTVSIKNNMLKIQFTKKKAKCCKSGMHFCKYPLDVFGYYPPVTDKGVSEYAEVEALDKPVTNDGKKYCSKKLQIGAKIGIPALVQASVEYIQNNIVETKKESATGYRSAATNTGYHSAASVEGKDSIALAFGIKSKAKVRWAVISSSLNGAKMMRVTDNSKPLNAIRWMGRQSSRTPGIRLKTESSWRLNRKCSRKQN